jgi:hypothetical protein
MHVVRREASWSACAAAPLYGAFENSGTHGTAPQIGGRRMRTRTLTPAMPASGTYGLALDCWEMSIEETPNVWLSKFPG